VALATLAMVATLGALGLPAGASTGVAGASASSVQAASAPAAKAKAVRRARRKRLAVKHHATHHVARHAVHHAKKHNKHRGLQALRAALARRARNHAPTASVAPPPLSVPVTAVAVPHAKIRHQVSRPAQHLRVVPISSKKAKTASGFNKIAAILVAAMIALVGLGLVGRDLGRARVRRSGSLRRIHP